MNLIVQLRIPAAAMDKQQCVNHFANPPRMRVGIDDAAMLNSIPVMPEEIGIRSVNNSCFAARKFDVMKILGAD